MNQEKEICRTRKTSGKRVHVYNSATPAIVNEDVFSTVSDYSWHLQQSSEGYRYVSTNTPTLERKDDIPSTIRLAELVLGIKGNYSERIAYLNGDPMDCRRENLAVLTTTQCAGLSKLSKVNKSGFKGVCWSKACKKWVATIGAGKKKITLGVFVDKENAAKAYDAAALKYYGEMARTNESMGLFAQTTAESEI